MPWLALALLPIAVLIAWRSGALEPAGRWLIRVATLLLLLAVAGVQLRCDRELRIVALVDVSPSTRGAIFRDRVAVDAKLKQLVPGRAVEIRYFADGRVTTSDESAATQTRMPETDADAVILMSDGRFDAPDVVPPVFAVVDASLDATGDARVTGVSVGDGAARIDTHAQAPDRSVSLTTGGEPIALSAGPMTLTVRVDEQTVGAKISPGDAWPENDAMSAVAAPAVNEKPWRIETASQLPTDAAAYLSPPAIVIPAGIGLSSVQEDRLTQYVRDLGGSLVIVGSPRAIGPGLRVISPLTGVPPVPEAEWMVMLDASGSMAAGARGDSRWNRALAAASDAVGRLEPQQRVSVVVFSRSAETVADSVSPADAVARLRSLGNRAPSGPTGLESALRSVATRASASPTRLLVITDADTTIDAPDSLADQLTAAQVSVFVLATGTLAPDAAVRRIIDRTGGMIVEQTESDRWSQAMRSLFDAASGDDEIADTPITTTGVLSGLSIDPMRLFRAFARPNVESIATASDQPVAATWQVGVGRVTTVAAEVDAGLLEAITNRLRRAPSDPRFAVAWGADAIVLTATDESGAMNGLSPVVVGGNSSERIVQTAPGRYEASLGRTSSPRIVRVMLNESVVATRSIPGRYAREFDVIGNDRESLEALAGRTGGRLIEASESAPLDLPRATHMRSMTRVLAMIGLLTLGAAIVFIRAPYLAERLARYARRRVR